MPGSDCDHMKLHTCSPRGTMMLRPAPRPVTSCTLPEWQFMAYTCSRVVTKRREAERRRDEALRARSVAATATARLEVVLESSESADLARPSLSLTNPQAVHRTRTALCPAHTVSFPKAPRDVKLENSSEAPQRGRVSGVVRAAQNRRNNQRQQVGPGPACEICEPRVTYAAEAS